MRAYDAIEAAKQAKKLEKQRRKMTDEDQLRSQQIEMSTIKSQQVEAARVALLKEALKVKLRAEQATAKSMEGFHRNK
jgi:hypothetical protein